MIICPFCQSPVKEPVSQKLVEDGHASNYYCPTYVKRYEDLKVSHYTRTQMKYLIGGQTVYKYTGWVPPFEIVWYTTGNLWVWQYDTQTNEPNELQHKKTAQKKDFVKTCERFKILVPFS